MENNLPQEGGNMERKVLSIIGVILVLFAFSSCSSNPEEGLLKSYFHAVSLNDATTMSTMALEPIAVDVASWEILSVGEERVEPAALAELNQKELEFKKKVEGSVGITLDARDALDDAKFDLERARTAAARVAARRKVNDLQQKYDEQYEHHKNLQKEYNDAKAAAEREEEITYFSLGQRVGDLPTIRDFVGEVHFKEVDVRIVDKAGATKDYKLYLRRYNLEDEGMGISHRGRWVIINFELLS